MICVSLSISRVRTRVGVRLCRLSAPLRARGEAVTVRQSRQSMVAVTHALQSQAKQRVAREKERERSRSQCLLDKSWFEGREMGFGVLWALACEIDG